MEEQTSELVGLLQVSGEDEVLVREHRAVRSFDFTGYSLSSKLELIATSSSYPERSTSSVVDFSRLFQTFWSNICTKGQCILFSVALYDL